jgi:predicted dehydrogenase
MLFLLGVCMACVRIGFGAVAPMHEDKLKDTVKTVGIIDTDPAKKLKIVEKGFCTLDTFEEGVGKKPTFWDVCTPPETHFSMIKEILLVDPEAHILVEKPLCLFHQIPELQKALESFRGRIVVNEQYLSSEIPQKVKEIAFKELKLVPKRIVIEMDKNRTKDFQAGRYRDPIGAFGYEGPHMITILQSLGPEYCPKDQTAITRRFKDIEIPEKLEKQGLADISYSVDGVSVQLFTSMKGDIVNRYQPYCPVRNIPATDTQSRYRVVAIEGENEKKEVYSVVGFL